MLARFAQIAIQPFIGVGEVAEFIMMSHALEQKGSLVAIIFVGANAIIDRPYK